MIYRMNNMGFEIKWNGIESKIAEIVELCIKTWHSMFEKLHTRTLQKTRRKRMTQALSHTKSNTYTHHENIIGTQATCERE